MRSACSSCHTCSAHSCGRSRWLHIGLRRTTIGWRHLRAGGPVASTRHLRAGGRFASPCRRERAAPNQTDSNRHQPPLKSTSPLINQAPSTESSCQPHYWISIPTLIELDLDRMSEVSDLVVSKYEWCRNEYLAEVHSDRITSGRGAYEEQKCFYDWT